MYVTREQFFRMPDFKLNVGHLQPAIINSIVTCTDKTRCVRSAIMYKLTTRLVS